MSKTDVAIIVGNYNQDAWVKQAVSSAKNQIVPYGYAQQMPTFQVIQSKDDYGMGASVHRNRAIEKADADWIIWLDADDLLPSHYLYFMWRALRWNQDSNVRKDVRMFFAAPMQFYSGCRLDRIDNLSIDQGKILPFGMSAMFPKKAWVEVDDFDETLYNMNDLDFWLRLSRAGYACHLAKETFMFKRDVPNSLLKKGTKDKEKAAAILKQFNDKHGTALASKILPYWVPQAEE